MLEARTLLSTYRVDRLTDRGEGSDLAGDLRYCITNAADGDRIQFGVTGIIYLSRALPDLTRSISIDGPGANLLTVSDGPASCNCRIFTVGGAAVTISGLTIFGGNVGLGDGGVPPIPWRSGGSGLLAPSKMRIITINR